MAPERHAPRFSSIWVGARAGVTSFSSYPSFANRDADEVVDSARSIALDVGRRRNRHTIVYGTVAHDFGTPGPDLQGFAIASDFIGLGVRATPFGKVGSPDSLRMIFEFRSGGRRLRVSRGAESLEQRMFVVGWGVGVEWRLSATLAVSAIYFMDGIFAKSSATGMITLSDGTVGDASNTNSDNVSGYVNGIVLATHFDLWAR